MTPFQPTRLTQTAVSLSLALMVTLVTLGGMNGLATEQHAGTVMAKAAAVQPAPQALAAPSSAPRG
jgi:hypothetical protein